MLNPNTNTILIHIRVRYLLTCMAYNGGLSFRLLCSREGAITLEKAMKPTVYTALILCNVNLSSIAHGREDAWPNEKLRAYQMDLS